METAGSFLMNPRSGNHPPVHVRYRVEAARLLAFIGSRETIPFLAELFRGDKEALVKAAAAEAIGKIGVDPEGLALGAFEDAIVPPSPLTDEAALTAIASAAGALSRFSGPPLSAGGIRILTLLSGSDRPPSVRNRAQREFSSLKN
jgi:outer membrane protein assembly factor BamB